VVYTLFRWLGCIYIIQMVRWDTHCLGGLGGIYIITVVYGALQQRGLPHQVLRSKRAQKPRPVGDSSFSVSLKESARRSQRNRQMALSFLTLSLSTQFSGPRGPPLWPTGIGAVVHLECRKGACGIRI